MQINLRDRFNQARRAFDSQLAELLVGRPDLSYAHIRKEFGISEKVIRRVTKQFNLSTRKRGPKPKRTDLQAVLSPDGSAN